MIIAHLDMDAFFAAIEERENPQFAGLPIVIGADPKNGLGRGVVSTANYEARKYGIHSAMPISKAYRLARCKKTIFLPVNHSFYEKVSEGVMKIIATLLNCYMVQKNPAQPLSSIIEQTSIDEAYLDLSVCNNYPAAIELVKKIKQEIKSQEKLTAKVGIGSNKLIAKMASASCGPDEVKVIMPVNIEGFLDPLPIGDIPGIGPKSEDFFHKKNIFKVSDLKKISQEQLKSWMGKWGEDMYKKVRGIDDSQVTVEREIKSISEQETFENDTLSASYIIDHLQKAAERVFERMQKEEIKGFRTVTFSIRFFDFQTITRAHSFKDHTDQLTILKIESLKRLLPFLDRRQNPKLKPVRLIGVGIENFRKEEPGKVVAGIIKPLADSTLQLFK